MAKILIVEDDKDTSGMLDDWLSLEHHVVECVYTGTDALDRLSFYFYDIVILDWTLPEMSGLEVLKAYRVKGGETPILMLTGRNTVVEKETGLDSGADDYLTKPFNAKELSARIRALLRRSSTQKRGSTVSINGLEIDPVAHTFKKDGELIELHPKEFALLEFFMRHPDQVFSTEALLDRVWSSDSESSPDTVRVTLQRLRKKIDEPDKPSVIETKHRVGYRLNTAGPSNES